MLDIKDSKSFPSGSDVIKLNDSLASTLGFTFFLIHIESAQKALSFHRFFCMAGFRIDRESGSYVPSIFLNH
jgi:hypothetical protein